MEARVPVDDWRSKGYKVVCQGHSEFGYLEGVPGCGFEICVALYEGAVSPNLDFGEGKEGAYTHVAQPGCCNDLAAKTNLAAR